MLSFTKFVLNIKKEIDTSAHTTGLNDMKHSHPPPLTPQKRGGCWNNTTGMFCTATLKSWRLVSATWIRC